MPLCVIHKWRFDGSLRAHPRVRAHPRRMGGGMGAVHGYGILSLGTPGDTPTALTPHDY